MAAITTLDELEALYGRPKEASTVKVARRLTPEYRALVEASPFCTLATVGPAGLDCSPRGEKGGVVHVHDDATLMLPDRRGNDRIDSLRNIVHDPRAALLFLLPGLGLTLRVNGRATIDADPVLLASFAVDGKAPRSVVTIRVEEVYFQCARAVIRSGLWDAATHLADAGLPTPGAILAALSARRIDGEAYDSA